MVHVFAIAEVNMIAKNTAFEKNIKTSFYTSTETLRIGPT